MWCFRNIIVCRGFVRFIRGFVGLLLLFRFLFGLCLCGEFIVRFLWSIRLLLFRSMCGVGWYVGIFSGCGM